MLLSSLFADCGFRYSTSGITHTRCAAENGLRLRSATTGSTCSIAIDIALALEHVQVGMQAGAGALALGARAAAAARR